MRLLAICILLGGMAASPVLGEGYGTVELAPSESGKYRACLKGDDIVRWSAEWSLEQVDPGPPPRFHSRDEAEGLLSSDKGKQRRVTEGDFLLVDGRIQMLRSSFTVWDEDGTMVRTMEKVYDHEKGVVKTTNFSPLTGETKVREFELLPGMCDAKELIKYLRGFPFRPGGELEFAVLSEKQSVYSLYATYEGIEEVETQAGTFSCYKIRLLPNLGILNFLGKMFIPYLYMWYTVEEPHFWVKYLGLEGDRYPLIDLELVEFHSSDTTDVARPEEETVKRAAVVME